MMNRNELNQRHWRYFLMLEKRFIESIEYVELNIDNYSTFSNSYALLIQAIGAEIDTVFKEYCNFNTSDRKNISDYANYILSNNPNIVNIKIILEEYNIEIQPFQNWSIRQSAQTLKWWIAFTDIKHNRYDKFKQANQENALNILGALYLLEMIFLKKITDNTSELDAFDESSKLFTLRNWSSKVVPRGQEFDVLLELFEKPHGEYDKKFDV